VYDSAKKRPRPYIAEMAVRWWLRWMEFSMFSLLTS
jgi:hypothetical protein